MGLFSRSKSTAPAFVYQRPGVASMEINPFLESLSQSQRAPGWIHLVHVNELYPTALVRMDFATKQSDQPDSWIYKPMTSRAETAHDAAKWAVDTAWALGATRLLNFRSPARDQVVDHDRHSIEIMFRNKVLFPKLHERIAGSGAQDDLALADKKGCWVWSFNVLGPLWNTLPAAKRSEIVAIDSTLRGRRDGFRSLPVPPRFYGWIYSNPMKWISFVELNNCREPEFVSASPRETGSPFPTQ